MENITHKLNSLLTTPVNFSGIKVILFDRQTQKQFSSLISHSNFLNHNFFLFDLLENKNRKKMDNLIAIVLIDRANYHLLITELKNPTYKIYFVFFTSFVENEILEKIARADDQFLIKEIKILNFLLAKIDCSFFSYEKTENQIEMAKFLNSFLNTAEISPNFFIGKNLENIFSALKNSIFKKEGTVFLLNRSLDPISPLLFDWRYEGLIHENYGIKNGIVKINKGEENFLLSDDVFFLENKFADLGSVNKKIKLYCKEKIEGGDIFNRLDEKSKLAKSIEVNMQMTKEITENSLKILPVSELEFQILAKSQSQKKFEKRILELAKNLSPVLLVKLLVIFSFSFKFENTIKFISGNFKNLKGAVEDYYFKNKQVLISDSYKITFKKNVDEKLAVISPFVKILDRFFKKKLSNKFLMRIAEKNQKSIFPLILFFDGGITYNEYFQIMNFLKEKKIHHNQVFIICSGVICYKDLIKI